MDNGQQGVHPHTHTILIKRGSCHVGSASYRNSFGVLHGTLTMLVCSTTRLLSETLSLPKRLAISKKQSVIQPDSRRPRSDLKVFLKMALPTVRHKDFRDTVIQAYVYFLCPIS